jgi:hypothetical protein
MSRTWISGLYFLGPMHKQMTTTYNANFKIDTQILGPRSLIVYCFFRFVELSLEHFHAAWKLVLLPGTAISRYRSPGIHWFPKFFGQKDVSRRLQATVEVLDKCGQDFLSTCSPLRRFSLILPLPTKCPISCLGTCSDGLKKLHQCSWIIRGFRTQSMTIPTILI